MIRWFAVAMVLALVPVVTVAPAASAAADEWCDMDPVVVIKTPGGNLVPLFNTNGVQGLKNQPALALAKVSYTVKPADGGRKTLVTMEVTLPEGIYGRDFGTSRDQHGDDGDAAGARQGTGPERAGDEAAVHAGSGVAAAHWTARRLRRLASRRRWHRRWHRRWR